MSPTEPIDELHRECLIARSNIRTVLARFIEREVTHWSPRPCPINFRAGTRNKDHR